MLILELVYMQEVIKHIMISVIFLIPLSKITINTAQKLNTLVTWTIPNSIAHHLLLMRQPWFSQQELELVEILPNFHLDQVLQKNKEIRLKQLYQEFFKDLQVNFKVNTMP